MLFQYQHAQCYMKETASMKINSEQHLLSPAAPYQRWTSHQWARWSSVTRGNSTKLLCELKGYLVRICLPIHVATLEQCNSSLGFSVIVTVTAIIFYFSVTVSITVNWY